MRELCAVDPWGSEEFAGWGVRNPSLGEALRDIIVVEERPQFNKCFMPRGNDLGLRSWGEVSIYRLGALRYGRGPPGRSTFS